MESNLKPYYLIVNIENLCYVNDVGGFATINEAAKFETLKEAERFLWKHQSLKNVCNIYKVQTHLTLSLEENGSSIYSDPDVLIKHNLCCVSTAEDKGLTSWHGSTLYTVNSEKIKLEKEETNETN